MFWTGTKLDGFHYYCRYAVEISINSFGGLDLYGWLCGYCVCVYGCVVVFHIATLGSGCLEFGGATGGIRATEVWVTLGSEGNGFRVPNSDWLR